MARVAVAQSRSSRSEAPFAAFSRERRTSWRVGGPKCLSTNRSAGSPARRVAPRVHRPWNAGTPPATRPCRKAISAEPFMRAPDSPRVARAREARNGSTCPASMRASANPLRTAEGLGGPGVVARQGQAQAPRHLEGRADVGKEAEARLGHREAGPL